MEIVVLIKYCKLNMLFFIQLIYEFFVIRCWFILKFVCKENNEDIFFGFNKINENLMLILEIRNICFWRYVLFRNSY